MATLLCSFGQFVAQSVTSRYYFYGISQPRDDVTGLRREFFSPCRAAQQPYCEVSLMRTVSTFVAETCSRTLFLILLFILAAGLRGLSAQPAYVEWLKFDEDGQTYLVLNAYEGEDGADRAGVLPRQEEIHPLFLEYPLRDIPDTPHVEPFLSMLENTGEATRVQSTWKPETLAEWQKILQVLTSRREIWLHGRVIHSRELSPDLMDMYAIRGYPSDRNPIFPHLYRGVLAVSDSEGKPLRTLHVDFAGDDSHLPVYELVTFANLGSRPLRVFAEIGKSSPIRLSGTDVTLAPRERTTRRIAIEVSASSIGKQESRAVVRVSSGGMNSEAFAITAIHGGWSHYVSGTLAAATTSLVAAWDAGRALPVAAAAGGILLALVLVGMLRNSSTAWAAILGDRSFGGTRSDLSFSEAARKARDRIRAAARARAIRGTAILQGAMASLGRFFVALWLLMRRTWTFLAEATSRFVSSPAVRMQRYAASVAATAFARSARLRKVVVGRATLLRESGSASLATLSKVPRPSAPEVASRMAAMPPETRHRSFAALPAHSDRDRAFFYQPLSRGAAAVRENAARLSTVIKEDFAPTADRRGATILRRLPQRAGIRMQYVINRITRLATNLYLYREFSTVPIPPADGSECVQQMHLLIEELEQASGRDERKRARRDVRKEAKRLARRLESNLEHKLVPRTTTNFQILWSLRLLQKILQHRSKNASAEIKNWLNGAERVIRNEGRNGIGPTVPEFLSYL